MTGEVVVAVPAALRFLLRPRDRASGERHLGWDPDATVAHLVQAAGVPLTEVGTVRRDGRPVTLTERTPAGSVLEVVEVRRPQPLPSGGFLLDVGLGTLARRLRLLGLDAAWSADADDADLAARATAEDRVLLTQDRGLLKRRAVGRAGSVRGALVRGSRPDDQVRDVVDRFRPPLAPLTRCTACGGTLHAVPKGDVAALLPDGTRHSYDDFSRCTTCGRVYWRGAHLRRIERLVRAVTDGGLAAPPA